MMRKQYTSVFKAKVVQERLHQALDYQTPAEVHIERVAPRDLAEVIKLFLW
jgi:hypothetical protein